MIHQNTIYTAGIETEEQVSQLTERISNNFKYDRCSSSEY